MTSERPIGIFDSGMGGLTVLRALGDALPHESFVYLGDTARLPYGTKSADTVRRYAVQAASLLLRYDVKLVVVACNTVSAVALAHLQEVLAPLPVVGVVEPGAEAALATAKDGPIAVLATEGTVKGGAYRRALQARNPGVRVIETACPLFVSLAEEGLTQGPIAESVAEHYLATVLAQTKPGVFVLGCTHFPVLAETLRAVLSRLCGAVPLVDSAATTAAAVLRLLVAQDLARRKPAKEPHRFLATDAPERFARVGKIFLGRVPEAVELVDLQDVAA